MSFEVTGKLIAKYDEQVVSDRFKKREFVLELSEEINGNVYTNYAKMQLVQNKCEAIEPFKEGDMVKVNFNIKGTKYEKDGKLNYFTNLDAWRVENASAATNAAPAAAYNSGAAQAAAPAAQPASFTAATSESADDLPF